MMEHQAVDELPMIFFITAEIGHFLTTNETPAIKKFLSYSHKKLQEKHQHYQHHKMS